jgi:hypothetical protein
LIASSSGIGVSGVLTGIWSFALSVGSHTIGLGYSFNGTTNAGQLSNGAVTVLAGA